VLRLLSSLAHAGFGRVNSLTSTVLGLKVTV
jgi:hypothetical protein